MMKPKWTKEWVREAIRDWHNQGRPIARIRVEFPLLYSAAARRFGSWQAALTAVGLPGKPRRKWTRQILILAAIEDRRRQGLSLSDVRRTDPPLYSAASKRFGNWGNALRAAGCEARPPSRRWSRDDVLEGLRDCHHRGLVNIQRDAPPTGRSSMAALRRPRAGVECPRDRAVLSLLDQGSGDCGDSGCLRPESDISPL